MSANNSRKVSNYLGDDSKRVLIAYHKLQMKRDQLIDPAATAILPLLDLLDDVRLKWKHAEDCRRAAEERVERLEQTKITLTQQLKERRELEHDAIGQISTLKSEKKDLQTALKECERRLNAVKAMIHKNLDDTIEYDRLMEAGETRKSRTSRTVNESAMETSEADKSGDEVRLRYNRGYRRSRSVSTDQRQSKNGNAKRVRTSRFEFIDEEPEEANENVPPPKRSRDMNPITTVTTITLDASGQTPTRASVEVHRSKKRSVSASRVLEQSASARRRIVARSPRIIGTATSHSDLRTKTPSGIGSSWTKGRPIVECTHKFIPYRKVIGYCTVCNRQITFMGKNLQCESCDICVHDQCKKRAPIPCLPKASFPATPRQNADKKIVLADQCPINPPYIPALLIRCICALEKDRLKTEGIYRIPGGQDDVNRITKDFQKYIPDLTREPTEAITGCIKRFLKNLKDTLIPRSSYKEFVKAAEDDDMLTEAINDLPDPNRDTLAYLCLHLQKVALYSAENKMPVDNLARCLAPTILRTDTNYINTLGYTGTQADAHSEVEQQVFVLKRLLSMPPDFWSDYLNHRMASKNVFTSATPTTHLPALDKSHIASSGGSSGRADCSVLGPVSSTPPQNFTPGFKDTRRIDPLF